jgi:glycine betaine/proline transport system ATP-binding protein
MTHPPHKVQVERLTKIFGPTPDEALQRLRAGVTKDEIFEDSGNVVAVADVSFAVAPGEIFVVMGLSGSGKSTLVRCVNRLIEPTGGELLIDGEDVLRASGERLREIRLTRVAMVFQHFALFPHRTVGENVEYGLKVRGVDPQARRERALQALEVVGLKAWADVPPHNLSGGMQQRVGLARALAVDPEVLLMDEPFSALDPLIRREMQEELLDLQRRLEMTVIFITHDLHEALILGSQIAIMKDGRFVQVGTPEEIVGRPADDYVASFTQDVDRSRVFSAASVMREAQALRAGEGAEAARARMAATGRGALHVVDDAGRPVGLITAGAPGALRRDFPVTTATTRLFELFGRCRAGVPLAVVDDGGRLVGVVHPLEVLGSLAGGNGTAAPQEKARGAPLEAAHG